MAGYPVVEKFAEGSSQDRYLSACATTDVPATNTVEWLGDGVTEVVVSVPTTGSLVSVMAVFDAPNDAVAAAWLTQGASTVNSSNIEVKRILPGDRVTFRFSAAINRADFRAVGAATPVYIEAT